MQLDRLHPRPLKARRSPPTRQSPPAKQHRHNSPPGMVTDPLTSGIEPSSDHRAGGGFVHLRVLDARVRLRLRTDAQVAQIVADWSRCLVAASPPNNSGEGLLVVDSELPLTQEMRHRLVANLTEEGIEHLAGRALMLHAAGVAAADGRVLALVAESGTGKTTAAHHLCRGSFGYVTDETVAVTPEGKVFPFAKPLSLVTDPQRPQSKEHQGPDALGLKPAPGTPLTLAGIVLLARSSDHVGPPKLEDVPILDAMMELIGHTSAFTRLDQPLQQAAQIVSRCGPVRRLTYREIADCDDLLEALVMETPEPVDEWLPVGIAVAPSGDGTVEGSLAARVPDDFIQVRDVALALVGQVPVLLGALGLTVWRAALGGTTQDDLHKVVVAQHGSHPASESLVQHAIEELIAVGLLQRAV